MSAESATNAATTEVMEAPKVRALRLAGGVLCAGPVLYLVLLFGAYPEHARRGIGPALVLLLAATALLLLRTGRPVTAARLLVYGGWAGLSLTATFGGGIFAPQLVGMPLAIMLAGWLLGTRHAVAITALSVLGGLALIAAAHTALLPQLPPVPALLAWLPFAIVATLVSLLIGYIVRTHENRLDEVRRLGAELAHRVEELAAERNQLHLIAENVPAMIFHGDREMRCRYANRQFADFFHGGGAAVEGMHLREILGETAFAAALPNIRRALAGEAVLLAGERQSKNGHTRQLEISLVPEIGSDAAVIGFYALKRDVTDLHQAAQALSASETQLRLVAENVPAMIAYNDCELVVRYANRRYLDFFGIDRLTANGRPIREVIGEAAFQKAAPLLRRAIAGEAVSYRALRRSATDGDRIVEVEAVPDRGADGVVRGAYALMRDITEQQRADDLIRLSQARLVEAQRIGNFGTWEMDLRSRRLHWSEAVYRIFERTPQTFGDTLKDFVDTVHPDDLPAVREAYREAVQAGKAYEVCHRILTPGGRAKHVRVHWEVFFDDAGAPLRSLGTIQDITEQVLARDEIQRLNDGLETSVRERTAELQAANRELESFAYSISHDLRAPLRGIDGFSHLLAEEYGDRLDAQGRGYLERVRRAAQRMGTLIDDILELSRVSRLGMRRASVDLSELAREILDERSRAAPKQAAHLVIAADCVAFGDPQLLRVLLQNLLENAWKYSSREAAPRIEFGCAMEDGERVFHVRDNGVGFDMAYASRLFAPFQRLHSPEEFEGAGIGLATVARVVNRHGGRVWAESAVGQGATFRFTLPAA